MVLHFFRFADGKVGAVDIERGTVIDVASLADNVIKGIPDEEMLESMTKGQLLDLLEVLGLRISRNATKPNIIRQFISQWNGLFVSQVAKIASASASSGNQGNVSKEGDADHVSRKGDADYVSKEGDADYVSKKGDADCDYVSNAPEPLTEKEASTLKYLEGINIPNRGFQKDTHVMRELQAKRDKYDEWDKLQQQSTRLGEDNTDKAEKIDVHPLLSMVNGAKIALCNPSDVKGVLKLEVMSLTWW